MKYGFVSELSGHHPARFDTPEAAWTDLIRMMRDCGYTEAEIDEHLETGVAYVVEYDEEGQRETGSRSR